MDDAAIDMSDRTILSRAFAERLHQLHEVLIDFALRDCPDEHCPHEEGTCLMHVVDGFEFFDDAARATTHFQHPDGTEESKPGAYSRRGDYASILDPDVLVPSNDGTLSGWGIQGLSGALDPEHGAELDSYVVADWARDRDHLIHAIIEPEVTFPESLARVVNPTFRLSDEG
jgi:hypothetical protein